MKIAVTYDNGEIFQHFGHTEFFKIYEIEDGAVVSAEVIPTQGSGHEALAGFLAEAGVEAVICGGMGEGAQNALTQAGIEIIAGIKGDADAAIEALLSGELLDAGCNCAGGCGGNCGGGCGEGGCHCGQPTMEGKNVGKTCRVHYRGTLNDGTQFDSSYDRGEPLEFVCGAGMMIRGFDMAVANMEVGQIVDVHLMPNEAYGEPDPGMIFPAEISQLPGSEELVVGQRVYLYNTMGQPFLVRVVAKDETTITFDANHEMAGKELNFRIELVEVQ